MEDVGLLTIAGGQVMYMTGEPRGTKRCLGRKRFQGAYIGLRALRVTVELKEKGFALY